MGKGLVRCWGVVLEILNSYEGVKPIFIKGDKWG